MINPLVQAVVVPELEVSCRDLHALWWRRHTTRHQLRLMLEQDPDRLYGDLGLTDRALQQECRKWFWEQ